MKVELINKIGILGFIKKEIKTDDDKTVYSDVVDIKGATTISFLYVFRNVLTGEIVDPETLDDIDIIIQESIDKSEFTDVANKKQIGAKNWDKKYLKSGAVSVEQFLRIKLVANNLESFGNNELEFNAFVVSSPETFQSDLEPEWILASGIWNDAGIWDDNATWNDGV